MGRVARRPVGWSMAALGAVVALAAGCSSTSPPPATSTSITVASTTTTSAPAEQTTVALYFLRGPYLGVAHRLVPRAPAIATVAMEALLGGPSGTEVAAGLSSAVPPGSALRGLTITDGTATANVSAAFAHPSSPGDELARVAQVVYTLTQFPSVSKVAFEVEGRTPIPFADGAVDLSHALGRSDVLGAVPAILVENPAVGDTLGSTLHLSGMANVFEAQFDVQVLDATGKAVVSSPVHASAGTGTWGTFDVTLALPSGLSGTVTVRVYDVSAKDGSPVDEVDLHLTAGAR